MRWRKKTEQAAADVRQAVSEAAGSAEAAARSAGETASELTAMGVERARASLRWAGDNLTRLGARNPRPGCRRDRRPGDRDAGIGSARHRGPSRSAGCPSGMRKCEPPISVVFGWAGWRSDRSAFRPIVRVYRAAASRPGRKFGLPGPVHEAMSARYGKAGDELASSWSNPGQTSSCSSSFSVTAILRDTTYRPSIPNASPG